jgi:hypothetical protein
VIEIVAHKRDISVNFAVFESIRRTSSELSTNKNTIVLITVTSGMNVDIVVSSVDECQSIFCVHGDTVKWLEI